MLRDYILREIEKMAAIITAARQKIFGGTESTAITLEVQIQQARGMLRDEVNFDLDAFLGLDVEASKEYICSFEGFNIENIGLLAECLSEIGFSNKCETPEKYLEKALQLYELCNAKSKTFSFEREANIGAIKSRLSAQAQ